MVEVVLRGMTDGEQWTERLWLPVVPVVGDVILTRNNSRLSRVVERQISTMGVSLYVADITEVTGGKP
jgi:hypothetical protein